MVSVYGHGTVFFILILILILILVVVVVAPLRWGGFEDDAKQIPSAF
jgi:hypothetical protein